MIANHPPRSPWRRLCLAALLCLGGCVTNQTAQTTTACPQPEKRFDISKSSKTTGCSDNPGGAAAGGPCASASDCAPACCNGTDVQLCIDNVCQSAVAACACAESAPSSMTASGGTCAGEQYTPTATARAGGAQGAACKDAVDCAEVSCGCPNGSIGYFASACINGKCDNSNACSCVAQQFTAVYGGNACGGTTPPASSGTCSGDSGGPGAVPRVGAPAGAACTDSSQCAEISCPCANGTHYFAAACTNGKCDAASACSCVASEYQKQKGSDVCAAPPPPPVTTTDTCDGNSQSQSGPRGGSSAGTPCTDSKQCAQATCSCSNGTVFYGAACVNGVCNNATACSCVQQEYQATFGKPLCQ